MRLLFIQSVSLFAFALILASCDSASDEPCTTEGIDAEEFYLAACLNGELWRVDTTDVAASRSEGSTRHFGFFAAIGFPPPPEGFCDPYPCTILQVQVRGQADASPGDYFGEVTSSTEGLNAYYSLGYDDASFAEWNTFDDEGQPVAEEPTWLQIAEFDTLNHVISGTFELTLPKRYIGLTPEEAGVPLPEIVSFREGRFRLPLYGPQREG